MKKDEFRDLLAGYQYADSQIDACVVGVELLEAFLSSVASAKTLTTATGGDVPAFAASLVERGQNERSRLVGAYHYAGMINNYSLQI
ncbi:hypothetical protein IH601_01550, partial [Candidatus Bipolaricaulota bacterium]|nr:hypothetical protein [Candidatus Bipolaricaulota bacterium]